MSVNRDTGAPERERMTLPPLNIKKESPVTAPEEHVAVHAAGGEIERRSGLGLKRLWMPYNGTDAVRVASVLMHLLQCWEF